ncbi:serine/threonine-protein kinase, partial [Actinocorallia lasiicapitis]
MERPLGSKYVLEFTLGRGATGEVWRGRSADGTALAFKVLHDALSRDPETVRRFLRESSILLGLAHPNLVRVHDLVAEGEVLAIVMDLVTGGDLRGLLERRGTFAPAEVCRIGAEAAAGLAAVHQAGVVHRDIKPENMLLDGTEQPPGVRVTDFGIARIAEQSGSGRSTMLVGTPQYVAPEVFDGQAPTHAADLYALGITLYEMCCGVTPFAGGSTLQILRRHVDDAPGRPGGVPEPLWELIAALLAKDPAARPGPTAAVANQLTALAVDLAGLPAAPALTDPPPSTPLIQYQPTDRVQVPRPPEQQPVDVPVSRGPQPKARRRRSKLIFSAVLVRALVAAGGCAWGAMKLTGARLDGAALTTSSGTPTAP